MGTMNKGRLGIITITNSGWNFGNRLQNYALQHRMESLGYEVRTIQSAKSFKKSQLLSYIRFVIKRFSKIPNKRFRKFADFDRRYIYYDVSINREFFT